MASLAIVWRNPNPVGHRLRWRHQRRELVRRVYVVQELVSVDADVWVNIGALEVFDSERKSSQETRRQIWRFGFGW